MSSAKSLKLVYSNQESAAVTKNIRFSLIHDSIDDQSWSDDPYCMLVVQYLIRKAAYSKHTRKYGKHTVELQLGQFITSHLNLAKLSTVYGLYKSSKNPEAAAKSAIDRVLKMLEKDGFLSKVVLGKGKDQCSVLTVVNWAKFQSNKVSILKTIPKTLNETIEKTKETHIQHSLQADIKTIEKTNVETLAKANTNKGLNNKEIKENDRQANQILIKKGFEHTWKIWKECKAGIGKTDTSPKTKTLDKNFKPLFNSAYFKKHSEADFKTEINTLCKFIKSAHAVEGFNRFQNMQLAKLLSEKQWRD